ncbi:MAG: hypothetical protein ABIG92_07310 [Candidatus Omnitrophota bacterium]
MKKPIVIHPFLFTAFPILFLFYYNVGELVFFDILVPLIVLLFFTFLLILVIQIFIRDNLKTGIIVSIFLTLFFSYGHIYDILNKFFLTRHRYIMPTWCIVFSYLLYIVFKTKKKLFNITKALNIASLSLIIIFLINISIYEIKSACSMNADIKLKDMNSGNGTSSNINDYRDIYYIILDAYASQDTLKEVYNYDNQEFIDYLVSKGFYVATKSCSNYPFTYYSLASFLNMSYLDDLAYLSGKWPNDYRIFYNLIQDNKIVRFLKSKKYKFICFQSGEGATDYYKNADLNIRKNTWCGIKRPDFVMILAKTTAIGYFIRPLMADFARELRLFVLTELGEIYKIKGPKFIFAHIICPHSPYVFGADGRSVSILEPEITIKDVEEDRKAYINQLIFLNKKVEKLIEDILSRSETPPVIILQGDHGTRSTFRSLKRLDMDNLTEKNLKERMRILNAYYLPGGGKDLLYPSITPVNTFRIIFNFYFSSSFKLLEDRSYFSIYKGSFYKFIDVTDKVKY